MPGDRAGGGETRGFQRLILDQIQGQYGVEGTFDRCPAHFAVALRGMGVANAEQSAFHFHRQIKRGACRQVADVKVAAHPARRDNRVQPWFRQRIADGSGKRF